LVCISTLNYYLTGSILFLQNKGVHAKLFSAKNDIFTLYISVL